MVETSLPSQPELRRLVELGASVNEFGAVPSGGPSISFIRKTVSAEMLRPAAHVPGRAGLWFDNCTILPKALTQLDGTSAIDSLMFLETQLNDDSLGEITSLPRVHRLMLRNAEGVAGDRLGFLTSCTELEYLAFIDTPIESGAVETIANHPHVTEVHLVGTRVGPEGIRHLTGLPSLE